MRNAATGVDGLYPSYGLFFAGSAAIDTLTLVFGARVLQGSTSQLGLLDAASNFGFTFAALGFGMLTRYLSPSRPLLAGGLALTAIPVILFATTGGMAIAYALSVVIGALAAAPMSAVPWYLCHHLPRRRWGEVFGKLSGAGAVGSAFGLAFAFGWLALSDHLPGGSGGERSMFVISGVSILLAAVGAWFATGGIKRERHERPGRTSIERGGAPLPSPTSLFKDTWVVYTVLPALLFMGIGMSYTGAVLFFLNELALPGAAIFGLVLLYRAGSWVTSNPTGSLVGRFSSLRLHQMAGGWRIAATLGIAAVAWGPLGPWSMVVAGLFFTICGTTSGALGVTGPSASTDPIPERYQGMAIGLFNGVSVGAMGVGAWLSGLLAQNLGFGPVLAISAGIMALALWLHGRY
ncbi:MAG: MFS transporter [SAR202 cluster bacterium]|nr:MFS transporter [SAR202 cluster bacterium]